MIFITSAHMSDVLDKHGFKVAYGPFM